MFWGNFYHNLTIFMVLIFVCFPVAAIDIDCKKNKKNSIEYEICSNSQLKKADKQVSSAYSSLNTKLSKQEGELLKQDQKEWLNERDYELFNCGKQICKIHFYTVRIKQLEAPLESASFNCSNATTGSEEIICSNRLLQHADGRMTKLYELHKDKLLQQDQRDWLNLRNKELNQSFCDVYCVWQLYKDRIELLVRYPYIIAPYK